MEKLIRNFLFKILGTEGYLKLVSDLYIRFIRFGLLKKKYPELFFLNQIIKPGFVCVDIGANVGYYSVMLSKLTGKNGQVIAIEPVPLFAKIFLKNAQKFALQNITLHQVALGNQDKQVMLVTPVINGVFRHGLTHISDSDSSKNNSNSYSAKMVVADNLFGSIPKIDFLKCDVEGYETILFPQMLKTLQRTKPLIQIEINSTKNIETLYNLLEPIGYEWHILSNNKLKKLIKTEAVQHQHGDFYLMCKVL
ncbi:MAG: FkbM family methyltransferase [Bacteroidia bacterium]